jgi:hypothetical protein
MDVTYLSKWAATLDATEAATMDATEAATLDATEAASREFIAD